MIWLVAFGLALKVLSHTAPFPFLYEAFAPEHAVWHMPRTDPPTVFITFDDGPNPEATPALLDVLARTGTPVTFFLIPDYVTEDTAPIIRRAFAEGHAVALHSKTRRRVLDTPEQFQRFVAESSERIETLAGSRPCRLFRPHAGWRGGNMYVAAARSGFRIVGWGWGLWDWNWYRKPHAQVLAERLARRASAGDIIVLHDGHHSNPRADRRYAVEAVSELIRALQRRGFRFGTLCDPQTGDAR
jgi:chitooligosaccharide deacetylase